MPKAYLLKRVSPVAEMHTAKLIIIWLALAFTCFLPASALTPTATENRVWEISTVGYDTPLAQSITGYDSLVRPTSAYDEAPNHRADGDCRATLVTCALFGQSAEFKAAESTISETQGAITNLGSRTVQSNAALLDALPNGGGMSGVFDHSTGNFVLRNSSDVYGPLPEGWVRQIGGHAAVRSDLGLAIGEDLSGAAPGRLSGFAVVRGADGQIQFRWNSGQINIGSHGSRAVPEPLRPEIENAVNAATGL
jgi:hypothetical protein